MTTTANSKQIGGDHYQVPIQPWDYILANDIGYCEGCAIKYITRWKKKGGINDLKKAIHFLEKLIEKYYADEHAAKIAYADQLEVRGSRVLSPSEFMAVETGDLGGLQAAWKQHATK